MSITVRVVVIITTVRIVIIRNNVIVCAIVKHLQGCLQK